MNKIIGNSVNRTSFKQQYEEQDSNKYDCTVFTVDRQNFTKQNHFPLFFLLEIIIKIIYKINKIELVAYVDVLFIYSSSDTKGHFLSFCYFVQ